jgi:multidrug efflux pump subunit AcrA (membrane-fusion protein)
VRVDDPAVPAPIGGRVTFVSPVIDAASSLVEVRVQFPNADRRIRPGVKGRLRVEGAL